MSYKFEKELQKRAQEFISSLEKDGISGRVVEDSFRDYTVKVSVARSGKDFGNVNLYYSPRRDLYSFKTHEMKDKSIGPNIEKCWYGKEQEVSSIPAEGYQSYVDGSFFNGSVGYGTVILKDGQVIEEFSGSVSYSNTHQVAGELYAVREVINWCHKNSIPGIAIFYDYDGIEKWVSGEWTARQALTQEYKKFVCNSKMNISWHKVDSHTGNRWNDRADELAKKGALTGKNE